MNMLFIKHYLCMIYGCIDTESVRINNSGTVNIRLLSPINI